ncbi:hypothetical protein PC119_g14591 [Phytophthora cactorum]|nr:hypothetical protein PC119_g14591 [Phytophthora cactorum]
MTLLDEYRRSIQSRTASRSNQDRKRRSRQLAPLNGSESGRRTPEIPEKVSAINQKAVQLAARQRTNNRKLRASSTIKLQELSSGVSPSRLETVERPDKVISNQEDSAPSRTQTSHESQRKPVGKPTALEQLILPHRPEPNNTVASTLTDVPLQLLQGARVDLRRWSVIVSDQTLRRIAAHNHRITSTSLKAQKLQGLLAGSRQRSFLLTKQEAEELSLSYSDARNQTTESLLLTGTDAITDAGLAAIALAACYDVTLVAITAVLKGCQKLTKLDLSGVRRCDDRVLRAIAKYGSSITQFVVAGCDRVGDIGLKYLASTRADQLELLDLTGCRLVSDTGLNVLCDAFQRPKLAHLVLADCPLITQDPIARLAFACPQLLTLNVHGCRISARVLQSLSSSWPFGPKIDDMSLNSVHPGRQQQPSRISFALEWLDDKGLYVEKLHYNMLWLESCRVSGVVGKPEEKRWF